MTYPAADTPATNLSSPPVDASAALRRLSALMCFVVAIGGALAELVVAWVWLSPSHVATMVVPRLGLNGAPVTLDGWTRGLGFLVSMVPLAVLFYALHQAYDVFDGYRRGQMFAHETPARLRRIGLCMLLLALARPLSTTLLGLVLTVSAPPGQRLLVIGLSIEDYMIATFGGLVLAIGHVMLAAHRLADDARQIV